MQRVAIDDLDASTDGRDRQRRDLADALGTTDVAVNHYRVPPGGRISGLHAHGDQEEVFVVVEGEATFETVAPAGDTGDAGEVTVGAGEAIRFAPGEFQSGRNDADADLVVYALGAPRDSEDVRIPLACPDCGHEYVQPDIVDGETPVLACPDCGAGSTVECPDCGSDDLHAVLGDEGGPVSACRACGFATRTL